MRIRYTLVKIDSWSNEIAYLYVDSMLVNSTAFPLTSGTKQCGQTKYKDMDAIFDFNLTHTANTLTINITTSLNESPISESFGIQDLFFLVDYVL